MALTNAGKVDAMEGITSSTTYVSLHLSNDNELNGHGYSRAAIQSNQWTISNAGVATGPADLEVYTANDGSAQAAAKCALYDAASGGNQLFGPEALTGNVPGAPANGQAFRITLTLNP